MSDNKKWVAEFILEGGIHIPNSNSNLPADKGRICTELVL